MKRLIFLLVCSIFFITSCGEEQKPKQEVKAKFVKTIVVGGKEKELAREFTGKVLATVKAELSFEVEGRLQKLPIKEGSEIKKGKLIAALDPKRYQDKVDQQKAKYDVAKAQFDRAAALVKQNYISRNEYDILESNMNVAKANLSTAEKDLKDTVIYAPFDGFVAKKYKENFEFVKAKEPIVSFHDIEQMDVEIQVPEYIILQAKGESHAKAVVIFEGIKKEYPIQFKEFASKADPDTQTYRAVYTMKAPKEINMLPGMSVTVKFMFPDYKNQRKPFYLIPASAVYSDNNNVPHVWVVDPKTSKLVARKISVANMTGDMIKVHSGLEPGEQIVIAGVNFLRAGELVKPIKEQQ